jgi:hypothetical protein
MDMAFRFAQRVLLPEAYPAATASRQGARAERILRYPGVKEAVSLANLSPPSHNDPDWPRTDRPLAVVRREADFATYQPSANPLFPLVIKHLLAWPAFGGDPCAGPPPGTWRPIIRM